MSDKHKSINLHIFFILKFLSCFFSFTVLEAGKSESRIPAWLSSGQRWPSSCSVLTWWKAEREKA